MPPTNSTGGAAGYMQDYDIAAYIGSDVLEINEVLRSAAYRSDHLHHRDSERGTAGPAYIDQGFQESAYEHIQSQERFRHQDEFEWEQVYYAGKSFLRLMPPPTRTEVVQVTYISASMSIDDLPEDARPAIEHAACAALLNCVINRVNSAPSPTRDNALDKRYWLEMAERQRDYYDNRYQAAIAKRPKQ
jgi:hypothetical protein